MTLQLSPIALQVRNPSLLQSLQEHVDTFGAGQNQVMLLEVSRTNTSKLDATDMLNTDSRDVFKLSVYNSMNTTQ